MNDETLKTLLTSINSDAAADPVAVAFEAAGLELNDTERADLDETLNDHPDFEREVEKTRSGVEAFRERSRQAFVDAIDRLAGMAPAAYSLFPRKRTLELYAAGRIAADGPTAGLHRSIREFLDAAPTAARFVTAYKLTLKDKLVLSVTHLKGKLEESIKGAVEGALDVIREAAEGLARKRSLALAGVRGSEAEQVEAPLLDRAANLTVDRQERPRFVNFTVVNASIDADGRARIELTTNDASYFKTDKKTYYASASVIAAETALDLGSEPILTNGSVTFFADLPPAMGGVQIPASHLDVTVSV